MFSLRNLWQNHRRLAAAMAVLLAVGIGGALWLGDFAEKRRFGAIELGMTEDEVLAILGPPGQYGPPGAKYGRQMWLG